MEVIAKTSGNGLLIQATEDEVKAIANAVNGVRPEKIEIGQKLPAIDYAATISKIKSLKNNFDFGRMMDAYKSFSSEIKKLNDSIENAASITI